jgi:PAS domain S-box-containing protein
MTAILLPSLVVLVTLQAVTIALLIAQRARRREAEARLIRDLAERERVESALRDSQERYARATAAGGVGVWDWDLETNKVYVDPALKAILGYRDGEIGHHRDEWARLVHPDDNDWVMERVQLCIEGTHPSYEAEHRMVHRDGSVRWFLARGSAVARDGRTVRIIGSNTDITERKKSEQALLEAQTDLSRLSRLTALGEFAASIAHEVRQPLTAILMNAKTALRCLTGPQPDLPEVRAALFDVVSAGQRADEIIRRNRELFRHRAVQKSALDLNAVISEVEILARTRLQASQITLATVLAPYLPAVNGDRVELQQVLLNLIANSIDAIEGLAPASRIIEVASCLTPDGIVKVSVRDTGVGLHDVDTQRMFAISYTTKPTGSGVGLSISRAIVEAHGGQLWAEQNAGHGATFSFTVPVHATMATTA